MEERTEYTTASTVIDQATVDAYKQRQGELCAAAIEAALRTYRCELRAVPQFTADGRVIADPVVVYVG